MQITIKLIPQAIIDQYDLMSKMLNIYVYMKITWGMYGLPQAGILADKLLKKKLAPHEYYEVQHKPGWFKHQWRLITFTLIVDNFGIKYAEKENADHLINKLKSKYTKIEVGWTGILYCGITMELCNALGWSFDAKTCNETINQVWPRAAQVSTIWPIHT